MEVVSVSSSSANSPENDVIVRSFPEFLTEIELESELTIDEEMIEEVMQELYKEITSPAATSTSTSRESSEVAPSPSALSIVESGKSSSGESCGASVSDSASSVMAGVEFAGGDVFKNGNKSVELSDDVAWVEECEVMDGCYEVEFGDEWLEKVMGWTPLQVEGWT